MVGLWFLLLFMGPLYSMDGAVSSSGRLVKAIRAREYETEDDECK